MAWRNFPISGMEDLQGEITDFSLLNRLSNNWTMGEYAGDFTFKWLNHSSVNIGSFIFGNSTNGLKFESEDGPSTVKNVLCQGYLNGTAMGYGGQMCLAAGTSEYPSRNYYFTFYCCVDDSTQKAYLFALTASISRSSTTYNCYWSAVSQYINSSDCYQLVTGFPIITYQWQSVPSISGKNGILSLSTLNDVNDGEPVETSDTSKFNLTDVSNVSVLVDAHFTQ